MAALQIPHAFDSFRVSVMQVHAQAVQFAHDASAAHRQAAAIVAMASLLVQTLPLVCHAVCVLDCLCASVFATQL